ncbi:hypothetical protein FACS189490_13870 [Clostridia bacterium]|nr:hypothetical protein FACS189490_13870 [Clostridia bacterium]
MTGQEKMNVLQMLEKGKITAEQAAKMLEGGDGSASSYTTHATLNSNDNGYYERRVEAPRSASTLASDLGRKFDVFMRDMEPKARSFVETAAEKINVAADSISRQLSASSAPARPAGYTERAQSYSAPSPTRPTSSSDTETVLKSACRTRTANCCFRA